MVYAEGVSVRAFEVILTYLYSDTLVPGGGIGAGGWGSKAVRDVLALSKMWGLWRLYRMCAGQREVVGGGDDGAGGMGVRSGIGGAARKGVGEEKGVKSVGLVGAVAGGREVGRQEEEEEEEEEEEGDGEGLEADMRMLLDFSGGLPWGGERDVVLLPYGGVVQGRCVCVCV